MSIAQFTTLERGRLRNRHAGEANGRRKTAEKEAARVQLWREQSGTVALANFGLPTDEALAAHANICARAEQYKESGAFPGAQMDQLRAMSYLQEPKRYPA
jgi:hypothetical protein